MEAVQETGNLIASDKVQGTNVYNAAGEKSRRDPRCDDRQTVRKSRLCDHVLRRLPRHWKPISSPALVGSEI